MDLLIVRIFLFYSMVPTTVPTKIVLANLLSGDSSEERALYKYYGSLGQLFDNFEGPIAKPKNGNLWAYYLDGKQVVYDMWEK